MSQRKKVYNFKNRSVIVVIKQSFKSEQCNLSCNAWFYFSSLDIEEKDKPGVVLEKNRILMKCTNVVSQCHYYFVLVGQYVGCTYCLGLNSCRRTTFVRILHWLYTASLLAVSKLITPSIFFYLSLKVFAHGLRNVINILEFFLNFPKCP